MSAPPTLITTDAAGEFAGRYISLNVTLIDSHGRMGKQVRGKKGNSPTSCICLPPVYQDRFRTNICSFPWHIGYSPQQTPHPPQNYHGRRCQCQHRQVWQNTVQQIPSNTRATWLLQTKCKRQRITYCLPCVPPLCNEHLLQEQSERTRVWHMDQQPTH